MNTNDDISKLKDKSWTSITIRINQDESTRNSYNEDPDDYREEEDDDIHELELNDYPHVIYIKIANNSLNNLYDLVISNLPNLTYLTTGKKSFQGIGWLTLKSIFK